MSMTLEEAIKNREECLRYLEDIGAKATPSCGEAVRWSVKALKALRPVSREKVDVVINSLKLRLEYNEENGIVSIPKFAVEQMIERLEALYEQ